MEYHFNTLEEYVKELSKITQDLKLAHEKVSNLTRQKNSIIADIHQKFGFVVSLEKVR